MPRLKCPPMILVYVSAATLAIQAYAQVAPPNPPPQTPAQQATASPKVAKERRQAGRAAKQAADYKTAADRAAEDAQAAADAAPAAMDVRQAAAEARTAATEAATHAEDAAAAADASSKTDNPVTAATDSANAAASTLKAKKAEQRARDAATRAKSEASNVAAASRKAAAAASAEARKVAGLANRTNDPKNLAKDEQQAAAFADAAERAARDAQDAANAAQVSEQKKQASAAATAARHAADDARAATDPQIAMEKAKLAATEAEKAANAAGVAHSLATASSAPVAPAGPGVNPTQDGNCPSRNDFRVGIANHWWRPQAGTDYFKLEYDVSQHQMRWFDYKKQETAGIEVLNGSILPVVYSREKVLVQVDCLHPTDTVSITSNDIALPEQGADIRGTISASTVTALAPSLDSLGSASAAGTALGTPGFGFGPPPTLASGTTSLFTPGTSKDGTSYTDAVIGIAPEALAIETNALINQMFDAINSYNELETGKLLNLKSATSLLEACPTSPAAPGLPGSVCGLQAATAALSAHLSASVSPNDKNLSAFNEDLAQTQALVSQLNGLAAGLNQAGLAARAIAIRQNMESIVGLLAEISNTYTDDLKYDKNRIISIDAKQTITTGATCQEVYVAISKAEGVPAKQGKLEVKTNPPDTPICHAMEQYTMGQFLRRYDAAVQKLKDSSFHVMQATLKLRVSAVQNALSSAIFDPQVSVRDKTALKELTEKLLEFSDATKVAPPTTDKDLTALVTNSETLQTEPIPAESVKELARINTDVAPTLYKSKAYPLLTPPADKTTGWVVDTAPTQNAANQLFEALLAMRSEVAGLDQKVGEVFQQMNDRYLDTWIDQTDALPPLTSNTIVRVGINVQRNYTPFTLTGGSTVGTASAANSQVASANSAGSQQGGGQQGGGQSAGGKGTQSAGQPSSTQSANPSPSGATSTTGSNDFTVLMEVHRFANFNLVGGVMGIHVKNYSFATVPEYASYTANGTTTTPGSGGTTTTNYQFIAQGSCPANSAPTTLISSTSNTTNTTPAPALYYCLQQTQTASIQPAGMLGIAWFPFHRDYFPRGRGALFQPRDLIPSLMAASSVTSLGSIFLGPDIEPFNGIDIFGGWATANVTGLAKGTSLSQVYLPVGSSNSPPTINTATHVKGGITFGIGFDISVFLQLFGKTQGPSLP